MWVADDRVEEYKAAGFVPAATSRQEKPAPAPKAVAEKPVKEEKKPEPKKAPVKSKK